MLYPTWERKVKKRWPNCLIDTTENVDGIYAAVAYRKCDAGKILTLQRQLAAWTKEPRSEWNFIRE